MSSYIIEILEAKTVATLILDDKMKVTIRIGADDYVMQGEDKEVFVTCVLAGFEETGLRFIKEL